MISLRVEIPNARELSPPCHPISILADEVCGCAQEWRAEGRGGVTRYNYQTRRGLKSFPEIVRVPSAGLATTPGVRSMSPLKRRKTSAVSQPASDNASAGVRNRRSTSARGDLPDAPDADLDDECAPFSPDGNVATVIYSHIADVQTRGALAMASRSWRDVSMLPASLPRRLDLDGLSKSQIDRLLDVDGLTSLDEERMLELAGVDKEDFCEWAAVRTGCLKLIVWALERGFPWGGYPPGLVSDDVLALRMWRANDVFVLRTWRAMCPALQERWPEDERPEDWNGVEMENGRVVQLDLEQFGLTGAVPAEVGQLASLEFLDLRHNELTSLQLADELAGGNRAARVAEVVAPQ